MKLYKALSFSDVLLLDKFSNIASRKDVDTSVDFLGLKLKLGIISANMTCVTGVTMARAMGSNGAAACLPRFWSVDENVKAFKEVYPETIVSCGIGESELTRAQCLFQAGATRILIDVAAGASSSVVEHTRRLRQIVRGNAAIIVGNFSNANALKTFLHKLGGHIDAVKVGIGGGSACITRTVTGCGMPTFASIIDIASCGLPIIADGGIRNSDDFVKALAAGASIVMCGGLLVGCDESSAEVKYDLAPVDLRAKITHKLYSGSASIESYEAQGKNAAWRTPEGKTFWIPACGSVVSVLSRMEGGLRSAMTYNNAMTIAELQEGAEFIEITTNGVKEGTAHGAN